MVYKSILYSTLLYMDDCGALLTTHTGQPTKQLFHSDICHHALMDWVDYYLLCIVGRCIWSH